MRFAALAGGLFLCLLPPVFSQDGGTTGGSTGSFFDDAFFSTDDGSTPPPTGGAEEETSASLLEQVIYSRGFSIEAFYSLLGFAAPGWSEAPWIDDDELPPDTDRIFWVKPGLRLAADLNLDIQLSEVLRIQQSVSFQVLDPNVRIKEFFFDYNFGQQAFLRAGLFNHNWGQSHNFQFTNLLARIPLNYTAAHPANGLSPKYLRLVVPIGIGGIEGIISARFITNFDTFNSDDLGYGLKYNIVQKSGGNPPLGSLDMDIGFFYHRLMPLRGFFSMQTTLYKTLEMYAEGLVSIPHETEIFSFKETRVEDITGSGALGLSRGFFNDKLLVNAEVFYSGERDAATLNKAENDMVTAEEREVEIMKDLNTALNLRFEPGGLHGLGLGLAFRWAFTDPSGQIIPAIYLSPAKHIRMTLAVPMALGERSKKDTGQRTYYYSHNPDSTTRPFSVIFAVSMNTEYRFGYYE